MSAQGPADRVSLDALLAHRDWVRALARRLVLDPNDADDVEQETWRMAVEKPPRHAESLRSWLAAVVRNAARMSGRSETRRARHEGLTRPRSEVPSPADLVAAAELQARLARAVLELDEPYRSTILYRFHEGLESAEIAARLRVPVETVRTRLKRGIERLRERMDVEIGEDRDAWCLLLVGTRGMGAAPAGAGAGATTVKVGTVSSLGAALGGGLAMALATKIVIAGAFVVAAATWWLWPHADVVQSPPIAASDARAAAPATERASRPQREARVRAGTDRTSVSTVPPLAEPAGLGTFRVHGRVLDDVTGDPLKDVLVMLVWRHAAAPGKVPSATTTVDGRFEIPDARDGGFGDVLVVADGYPQRYARAPWLAGSAVHAKGDMGDVRLSRGKRVAGRVVGADGRTPVVGARICLTSEGGSNVSHWFNFAKEWCRSDAEGRFAADPVPPSLGDPYTMLAVAPDGVGWTQLPAVAGKADLLDVTLRLRAPGAVLVTVRDEAGAPQANVRVVASPRFAPLGSRYADEPDLGAWITPGTGFEAVFVAATTSAGVASFTSLPTGDEGGSYDFVVNAAGGSGSARAVVVPGVQTSVTVVVTKSKSAAVVAGVRIVDLDGRPIEGASVVVRSGDAGAKAISGPDGVAILRRKEGAIPTQVWGWFSVSKEGFAKRDIGIHLRADDGSPLEIVVLEKPTPIEGRIVDQDGAPVAGCRLELRRKDVSLDSSTSEADGRFSFPDATAGEWTLGVGVPQPYDEWRRGDRERGVNGGDRDVVLALHRLPRGMARVVAALVDADTGAALSADEGMLIPAEDGGEQLRGLEPRTELGEGTVTLERMRPGRWHLWVNVPDRGVAFTEFQVFDGQTEVPLRVSIGGPGTLRGRCDG